MNGLGFLSVESVKKRGGWDGGLGVGSHMANF